MQTENNDHLIRTVEMARQLYIQAMLHPAKKEEGMSRQAIAKACLRSARDFESVVWQEHGNIYGPN